MPSTLGESIRAHTDDEDDNGLIQAMQQLETLKDQIMIDYSWIADSPVIWTIITVHIFSFWSIEIQPVHSSNPSSPIHI